MMRLEAPIFIISGGTLGALTILDADAWMDGIASFNFPPMPLTALRIGCEWLHHNGNPQEPTLLRCHS